MFTQKGILAFLFLSVVGLVVSRFLDGMYVTGNGYAYQLHTSDIQTILFCLMAACVGLFLLSVFALGVLPSMPGLGSDEQETPLEFTRDELIAMDKEDEPIHNEQWRLMAAGAWDGQNEPRYYDYRGRLIDYLSNTVICYDPQQDKRRVK